MTDIFPLSVCARCGGEIYLDDDGEWYHRDGRRAVPVAVMERVR